MILSFSKKMIPNTGIRVCYTQDFHTITDFGANEEGLPLMILSDHFETAPFVMLLILVIRVSFSVSIPQFR